MSEFVLTGSDVFGRYCRIEQLRYGVPNEMYLYKVVASLRSNCWCEVPYKTASKEVRHDSIEDCILAICCGIDETEVLRFRAADIEFVPKPTCDRNTHQKVAEEMFGKMRHSTKEETDAYEAMLKSMSVELHPVDIDALLALADDIDKQTDGSMFDAWLEDGHYIARRIREALGVK